MNDSHVAFSSYVIYHLKALLHLASLFFNEDLLLSGLTSSLYVYTRFFFALGFKIFLMWACLKPHTLTSPQCYILLGNSCFERGFNDRVQSGFSPSNSASNFRKRSLFFVWMCWSRVATGQPLCQHFCARWEKIGTRLHFSTDCVRLTFNTNSYWTHFCTGKTSFLHCQILFQTDTKKSSYSLIRYIKKQTILFLVLARGMFSCDASMLRGSPVPMQVNALS